MFRNALVEGRTHVVINEAAVRKLGYGTPERALGKTLPVKMSPEGDVEVIGVVRDFGILMIDNTLPISATVFIHRPEELELLDMKLAGQFVPKHLASLEALWKRTTPGALPADASWIGSSKRTIARCCDRHVCSDSLGGRRRSFVPRPRRTFRRGHRATHARDRRTQGDGRRSATDSSAVVVAVQSTRATRGVGRLPGDRVAAATMARKICVSHRSSGVAVRCIDCAHAAAWHC